MDVNIIVDFSDDAKKLIAGFVNALTEAGDKPAKKTRAKKKAAAKATKAEETVEETPAATPEPEPVPEPEKPAKAEKPPVVSLEELREAAKNFIKANGREATEALLNEHGASSLTSLLTEHYDEVHAKLVAGVADQGTTVADDDIM